MQMYVFFLYINKNRQILTSYSPLLPDSYFFMQSYIYCDFFYIFAALETTLNVNDANKNYYNHHFNIHNLQL